MPKQDGFAHGLNYEICGAPTRNVVSRPFCTRPAGWGTDHAGEGRCKLHGGCSKGAPKGNQYAKKSGIYSTIFADCLDDEEKVLFDEINTDKLAQVEEAIRLLNIREYRILQRINSLKANDREEHNAEAISYQEEALTKIAKEKARMLLLKEKFEDPDDGAEALDGLIAAIRRSDDLLKKDVSEDGKAK